MTAITCKQFNLNEIIVAFRCQTFNLNLKAKLAPIGNLQFFYLLIIGFLASKAYLIGFTVDLLTTFVHAGQSMNSRIESNTN